MKYSILIGIIILCNSGFTVFSQTPVQEDQLLESMCEHFERTEHFIEDVRLDMLYERFLKNYYEQFDENEVSEIDDRIFYRFQKVCPSFREYLYKINPTQEENWLHLKERSDIAVSEQELSDFKQYNSFYYAEFSGAITHVIIMDGIWEDSFTDGTYSKSYFKWFENGKFELEFIESDNSGRKSFSHPGDIYNYEIISREDGFYWILVAIPNQTDFYMFRLYYLQ